MATETLIGLFESSSVMLRPFTLFKSCHVWYRLVSLTKGADQRGEEVFYIYTKGGLVELGVSVNSQASKRHLLPLKTGRAW